MKVALPYLYQGKTSGQGVFEETFAEKLIQNGIEAKVFYPTNKELRKIPQVGTILSMASLREYKEELRSYDLIYSTNGTGVALMDKEIGVPVLPVYHSTGFSIYEKLIADKNGIDEFENYLKYEKELKPLELVSRETSGRSLQNWGLCGIYAAQNANNIVAVSESVNEELIERGGAREDKIEVIENGIEDYWFEDRTVCPECDKIASSWGDKPTVMWVGRMGRDELNFKIKGIDRVLEVMGRLDSREVNKVVIALVPTDASAQNAYANLFTKRGIHLITNHPYEHLPHLMKKGDVFLMASRYEGFSLTLVEAMASGMVPISYSIGVAPEAVSDGKNGYIVSNTSEMVNKVRELVANPEIKERLSANASDLAEKRFNINTMILSYQKVFTKASKNLGE